MIERVKCQDRRVQRMQSVAVPSTWLMPPIRRSWCGRLRRRPAGTLRARPHLRLENNCRINQIDAFTLGSVSLGDLVKSIIEGLHKIGILKLGLILAFFGVIALAIPDDWLLELKVASGNTYPAILALLGVCMIVAWSITNDFTLRVIGNAMKTSKSRSEFKKLSNKARLLLLLQVRQNSEQIPIVVADPTVQELMTRQFLYLGPGNFGQSHNRASIRSEKWRWLTSDLQFVERRVQHDKTQEQELHAMIEQAKPGPNSWMSY